KAIHGTMKESLNKVPATVGRLVKQTGADTTLKNAKRDRAYFAWVCKGDTCPYCLMMAAIGWQKAGKKTLQGGHADHIHAHCDCQYMVDFKGDLEIPGYDPEKIRDEIMQIVDPDGEKYGHFDDFLDYHGRYSVGLEKRDKSDLNLIRIMKMYDNRKPISLSRIHVNKDDQLWKNLQNVKPYKNYEDFAIHGDSVSSKVLYETTSGETTYYNASEYADMILSDPSYNGGNIRLLSCGMGAESTNFAQELSNILGKEVIAATETLWTNEKGELFISDSDILAEMWYNGIEVKETGYWRKFRPIGKGD
ncbi:MAG: hypothetical protein Q4B85_06625, partial [Lachnospiraceae bacterium]|nr:hypothetical protein [Lachnospiraceae bacterium]